MRWARATTQGHVRSENAEPVKTVRNAGQPTWKEREHHEATQRVAYAESCKRCVSGRGKNGHHGHRQVESVEHAVTMIRFECSNNARNVDGEHESTMKALVMIDQCSGAKLGTT